jgi:hypothetical protein
MDTAATAIWLLGITPPPDWAGRPVVEAYRSMPTALTAGGS